MQNRVFISCGINNAFHNNFIVANSALMLWLVDRAEHRPWGMSAVQRSAYNKDKERKCVLSVNVLRLYHSSHWHRACLNG